MASIFNEEHQMFRDALRKYFAKEISPHIDEWEEARKFPRELYRQFGAEGFLGIKFPEKYGGAGSDKLMASVLIEEMNVLGSGGLGAGILMHSEIVLNQINEFGTDAQKEKYLPGGIRGDLVGCLGLTEPNAGSDLSSIGTRALKDGEYYVINGSKTFITNAPHAEFILLFTKTDPDAGYQGMTCFLVDTDTPGFVKSRKLEKVGWWSSETGELTFEDMKVHESQILGGVGQGFFIVMQGLEWERLIIALGSVSASQECWEMTKKYCEEREQFGRPIIDFQVTRHKLADMLTDIAASRALAHDCLWKHVNGINCVLDVTAAKIFCCDVATKVADQCLQLHGGYGYMLEYPVQRFWRDARLGPIGGGTTEVQKEIIKKLIGF